MAMNPLIEVDGDRGRGQWYFVGPFNFHGRDEPASWVAARYDEEYVKVDGVWKFQVMRARARLNTDAMMSVVNAAKADATVPTVPVAAETAPVTGKS
jgi:hypothetical protein